MSGERNFDNYVKNQLEDYSSVVSPHIWENIVAERRKKKPVGFWPVFVNTKNAAILAGVAIIVFSGLWFLNKKDATKNAEQAAIKPNTDKQISPSGSLPVHKDPSVTFGTSNETEKNSSLINLNKKQDIPGGIILSNANGLNKNISKNISSTQKDQLIDKSYIKEDEENIDPKKEVAVGRLILDPIALSVLNSSSPAVIKKRDCINVSIPGCPTVEEQAAGDKKYIEVYFGPDLTLRNFKDTTAQSLYLQKRKASTDVSFAYSAGIRYTKVFKNGVSVKAGLNYSQINEKFSFVQNNLVQVTYIIDPNTGDTTGSYTVTGTRKKTTYNKYRTLDIPLLIGYEIGNGRLHVNISAGAMVNLYSWQRGEVLDTNYLPVSITTGKSVASPYQFKNNVGVGLTGGVGVYYKLTDLLHVLAEPYFRYNLKPMSKEALTLQQKYNTIGVRLGVRLDLK